MPNCEVKKSVHNGKKVDQSSNVCVLFFGWVVEYQL